MKKQLPTILLLSIILAGVVLAGLFISHYGMGIFLRTAGVALTILSIVIFSFFLSIAPGYGWVKSINFNKNYIMIFASLAICMVGIVLIVFGQRIHIVQVEAADQEKRCLELRAGNAAEVLKKDWYSLRDLKESDELKVYLFQQKSDTNEYKIVASLSPEEKKSALKRLKIISKSLPKPVTLKARDNMCKGVFEKDISLLFTKKQNKDPSIQFDIRVTFSRVSDSDAESMAPDKTFQCRLQAGANQ